MHFYEMDITYVLLLSLSSLIILIHRVGYILILQSELTEKHSSPNFLEPLVRLGVLGAVVLY